MALIALPYPLFVNGTPADGGQVTADFSTIVNAINGNLDNTNIGAAGIFASQIKGTSALLATFTAATVGFSFLPGAVGITPLSAIGIAGQTVDIFEILLTSGGTKALAVSSGGNLLSLGQIATNGAVGAGSATGDITAARSATAGNLYLGNGTAAQQSFIGASANVISFFPTASSGTNVNITAGGGLNAPNGNVSAGVAASTNTDLSASRSASTGVVFWGSTASTNCGADFGINTAGTLTFKKGDGTAFIPITCGTVTQSSDAAFKMNIAPIENALETLSRLKPSSFDWISDGQPDLGFIAQDVEAVLPELTRTDGAGHKGLVYAGFTALNSAAILEFYAEFKAYMAAHP